jgi:hypothetical protein
MATPTKTFNLGTSSEPIHVSKVALAIIITFSVVSLVVLAIAIWIVFRFTCTSRGRRAGYAVRDGRNEHVLWWKHANPPADSKKIIRDVQYWHLVHSRTGSGRWEFEK